jgi:hypothetical protein
MHVVHPPKYNGASTSSSKDVWKPFELVEHMEWQTKVEEYSCRFGSPPLKELVSSPDSVPSMNERDGLLWDFGQDLVAKGFVLDTKGYSACFRVNKKQCQQEAANDSLG